MRIVFDVTCDTCHHTYEDYDHPSLPHYGDCPACKKGKMLQVVTGPKTITMVASTTGKTKSGMKWSVDPRPRKFVNGKLGAKI